MLEMGGAAFKPRDLGGRSRLQGGCRVDLGGAEIKPAP